MVTISIATKSEKAVAFAKKLMKSKQELLNEIQEDSKTIEFNQVIEKLILQNENRRNTK